jgi:DNA-binding transcriptional ArsR family regulator
LKTSTQEQRRGQTPSKPYRGQKGKSVEERVVFALAHRTRLYVLTLLNEGSYTIDEIAGLIGEERENVKYHIKELMDAGAIELAKAEPVRNTQKHYYRAVEMPTYSDEELEAMSADERQAIIGLTIQCLAAEVLASFWAGKMEGDPKLWLGWRWFNLDAQGREELAEEQMRWWSRIQEIEAESANRRTESGEDAQSVIVASMSFPRERTAPVAPPHSNFSER